MLAEQAIGFLVSQIPLFIATIKKAKVVENSIQDLYFDCFLNGLKIEDIETETIKFFEKKCDRPIDIVKFRELLIEYFLKHTESRKEAEKLSDLFLLQYFDNMTDTNKAALSKIILDVDDIKKQLEKIRNGIKNIKTIEDVNKEINDNLRDDAEIKDFDLRYFKIDDFNFKKKFNKFLDSEKEVNISFYCVEEGIYCILNYLKYERNLNDVFVINDEQTWNNLGNRDVANNVLIANFRPSNVYKKYNNCKHVFVYNNDNDFISGNTIDLRKRTLKTIIKILEDNYGYSYDKASRFCKETNGNYYLIKSKLFNAWDVKFVYKNDKEKLYSLFIVNSFFDSNEYNQFFVDNFGIDCGYILNNILSNDVYKKYFKVRNEYNINFVELLDPVAVWQKYGLYKEDFVKQKILMIINKVAQKFMPNNSYIYIGFVKSLIIYKTLNSESSNDVFNNFSKRIVSSIKSMNDWKAAEKILEFLIELSPEIIIKRIISEFKGEINTGLVDGFKNNESDRFYIFVLYIIEKSLFVANDKKLCIRALFEICNKNFEYRQNNPEEILRKLVFPGIDTPIDFNDTKDIFDDLINEFKTLDLWDVFYGNIYGGITYSWHKPVIYCCGEEFVNDIQETYMYCFTKLRDIDKDCDQLVRWVDLILHIYHSLDGYTEDINNSIKKLKLKGEVVKIYLKYRLLALVYKYNLFYEEGVYSIEESSKQFIKKIVNEIQFQDNSYNDLLYFQNANHFTLIDPINSDDPNYFKLNEDMARTKKKRYFSDNKLIDIENVIKKYKIIILSKLVKFEQSNFQIGGDIAEFFDERQFNRERFKILLKYFLDNDIFHREIFDYMYNIKVDANVINDIKSVYRDCGVKNTKFYTKLLCLTFRVTGSILTVEDESDKVKTELWLNFNEHILLNERNHESVNYVLENLYKYGNFSKYISILDLNKKLLGPDELKKWILKLSSLKEFDVDINNGYALSDLMEYIHKNKFDIVKNDKEYLKQLSCLELNILYKHSFSNFKFTKYLYENHPDEYAEYILENEYGLDVGNPTKLLKRIMRYNGFSFRLDLNRFTDKEFYEWNVKFKSYLEQKVTDINLCKEICDDTIGSIIGLSNIGSDGIFPKVYFREYIENNYSEQLAKSIIFTKYNKRGIYSPEQGEYNYRMAEFYSMCIEKCKDYKNTVKVLKRLREMFIFDAEHERELFENEEI